MLVKRQKGHVAARKDATIYMPLDDMAQRPQLLYRNFISSNTRKDVVEGSQASFSGVCALIVQMTRRYTLHLEIQQTVIVR